MKSAAPAAVGGLALALALLAAAPARGDPATTPGEGCLGETFHVAIEYHGHGSSLVAQAGGQSPSGFFRATHRDLTMSGTYVRELRDGKPRWVSRSISWNGEYVDFMPACARISCDAGGQLELGPSDGGVDALSPDERAQIAWHCQPMKTFGNCFRETVAYPPALPFPNLRGTRETLRSGSYYVTVDRDGTRYSEWVVQRGNEHVTIGAAPSEIDPNAKRCVEGKSKSIPCPDEATSHLTITTTCDGLRLANRRVGLRIDVKPRSGYHNHVAKRPRGKLVVGKTEAYCGVETGAPAGSGDDTTCLTVTTDTQGEAKVDFKSPLTGSIDWAKYGAYYSGIAGDYWITAKDAEFTEVRDSTLVLAKVDNLQEAPFDDDLVHSDPSSAHPEPFYGTPGTVGAFSQLAKAFHRAQDDHNDELAACGKKKWPLEPLSQNDIALPTGGIFDWHQTWSPSHSTHNKGEGGDFNRFGASVESSWHKFGTECDGSMPSRLVWDMQILLDLGKDYGHWDCSDLGASGGYPAFAPDACAKGEIPAVGEYVLPLVAPGHAGPPTSFGRGGIIFFPPDLHLHVED